MRGAVSKGRVEPHGSVKLIFEAGRVVTYDLRLYPSIPDPEKELVSRLAKVVENYCKEKHVEWGDKP